MSISFVKFESDLGLWLAPEGIGLCAPGGSPRDTSRFCLCWMFDSCVRKSSNIFSRSALPPARELSGIEGLKWLGKTVCSMMCEVTYLLLTLRVLESSPREEG